FFSVHGTGGAFEIDDNRVVVTSNVTAFWASGLFPSPAQTLAADANTDVDMFADTQAFVIGVPDSGSTDGFFDDSLHGGDGTDFLVGGPGGDALYGDAGNDILFGDDVENVGIDVPGWRGMEANEFASLF